MNLKKNLAALGYFIRAKCKSCRRPQRLSLTIPTNDQYYGQCCGGDLVVSIPVFYSVGRSSNPVGNFNLLHEKTLITEKEAGLANLWIFLNTTMAVIGTEINATGSVSWPAESFPDGRRRRKWVLRRRRERTNVAATASRSGRFGSKTTETKKKVSFQKHCKQCGQSAVLHCTHLLLNI